MAGADQRLGTNVDIVRDGFGQVKKMFSIGKHPSKIQPTIRPFNQGSDRSANDPTVQPTIQPSKQRSVWSLLSRHKFENRYGEAALPGRRTNTATYRCIGRLVRSTPIKQMVDIYEQPFGATLRATDTCRENSHLMCSLLSIL